MTDFIWRVQCAYWFLHRLGLSWLPHVWHLSGLNLEAERRHRLEWGWPYTSPQDSVDEELACWEE